VNFLAFFSTFSLEAVVAESVVVIKKLLQTHPNSHTDIIKHMARLADNITVPQARASILWLLGEYSHLVPKLAPDVLRKMAKIFVNEVGFCNIAFVPRL
jgi:AP-3 complex subunit beta